jgi:inosine-uridine nucleoside N-ribohydrolase
MDTPKKKMIIDTDAGIDDSLAIILALLHPDWEVIGITCVFGNVHVEKVLKNVGVVLNILGKPNIPVFRGADHPIIGKYKNTTWIGHGEDGFGGRGHTEEELVFAVQKEHAVNALLRLMDKDVHLVALGPLTNVALAISMDPTFADKLGPENFTIMGGAHYGKGNAGLSSEFNVHADPEAAHICLEFVSSTTMVSFEVTTTSDFGWDWHNEVLDTKSNKVTKLLSEITQAYKKFDNKAGFVMCDALAVAIVLYPEIIKETVKMNCQIELSGGHTRGSTVFDWYHRHDTQKNVKLVLEIVPKVFVDHVTKLLLGVSA